MILEQVERAQPFPGLRGRRPPIIAPFLQGGGAGVGNFDKQSLKLMTLVG